MLILILSGKSVIFVKIKRKLFHKKQFKTYIIAIQVGGQYVQMGALKQKRHVCNNAKPVFMPKGQLFTFIVFTTNGAM